MNIDFIAICIIMEERYMKKWQISALSATAGTICGAIFVDKKRKIQIDNLNKQLEKINYINQMLNQWIKNRNGNFMISDYCISNGYKNIAVYGISYAGERLIDELEGTDVEVLYGIDRNADNLIYKKLNILKPTDDLPEVDAVIVTAIYYFEEIKEDLVKIYKCPIISLEDIIYDL
jgi:hypothetical protein